ncbi:hypothetical protein SAMN05216532_0049 [Streptomyces sp. 2231.1]|nr:hypothetical protein SAMN05216532_0049 [Streptomyces sp. 2231.1]
MAGDGQLPDEELFGLYRRWAAGGTRRHTAERVLDSGVAIIGMGTALAVTPTADARPGEQLRPVTWSGKALASAAGMAQVRHQMRRIARESRPTPNTHPAFALISERPKQRRALRRYRAWLSASQGAA